MRLLCHLSFSVTLDGYYRNADDETERMATAISKKIERGDRGFSDGYESGTLEYISGQYYIFKEGKRVAGPRPLAQFDPEEVSGSSRTSVHDAIILRLLFSSMTLEPRILQFIQRILKLWGSKKLPYVGWSFPLTYDTANGPLQQRTIWLQSAFADLLDAGFPAVTPYAYFISYNEMRLGGPLLRSDITQGTLPDSGGRIAAAVTRTGLADLLREHANF
ncbi:hypothetical protein CNMCM5623_005154 [Aspergillus felis]|uniref:Uncharacterized protein n=1 Tax=Aspergillus felis TaxID=1287682 RepID=A0A8H6PRN7_9EURO|nr:hypothetical protein CNMCM5623_005154 [Aspergillus felis]KAF7176799.1 hypothetical protein CNMCM7691_003959 [Aspergillus felis]